MKFEYRPNCVELELVHGCNRRCSYCGTMGFERKFIFGEEYIIKHICDLINNSDWIKNSDWKPRIVIAGSGEPTLHPKLLDMLKMIRNELSQFHIQMISNGYWIEKYDYPFILELMKYVNDLMIDDYDKQVSFEKIKEIVGEDILVKRLEETSWYDSKDYRRKRIVIVPPIIDDKKTFVRKLSNHCGAGSPPSKIYNDKICTRIFRDMIIHCDGNVPICCQDFRGEYKVCNVLDDGIKKLEDVYHHERLDSARKILKHNYRKSIYPCKVCTLQNIRVGFLPDVEKPTGDDYKIVSEKHEPLYKIVKREWELNPVNKGLFEI